MKLAVSGNTENGRGTPGQAGGANRPRRVSNGLRASSLNVIISLRANSIGTNPINLVGLRAVTFSDAYRRCNRALAQPTSTRSVNLK